MFKSVAIFLGVLALSNSLAISQILATVESAYFIPAPSNIISNPTPLQALLDAIRYGLNLGLTLQFPNGPLKLGLIPLPLNFLYNSTIPGAPAFACHVCVIDCYQVHNRFGGQIIVNPNNPSAGYTCACYDQAQNGTVTSTQAQCGPVVDPTSDVLVDAAITDVAIFRKEALLCSPTSLGSGGLGINSNGCAVDCVQNHQYASGQCGSATPVARSINATDNGVGGNFCNCAYTGAPTM